MIAGFGAMAMMNAKFFNSRSYSLLKRLLAEMWNDPEYKKRHAELSFTKRWSKEKREQFSKSMLIIWQKPEYQAVIKAARLAMWQDPSFQAKMSEAHKQLWKKEEHRSKMADRDAKHKELWRDQAYRERQRESRSKSWTPERKATHAAKVSAAFAARKAAGLKMKPVLANQPSAWTPARREAARQRELQRLANKLN